MIVATKGGLRMDGTTLVRDASAGWLRAGVEASLRNLATDYIDLYQVHWPDPSTPAEETAAALAQLVSEGLIRHVGVSNYDAKQIDELSHYWPGGDPTTAVPHVPARHRGRDPALRGGQRYRRVGLRPAGPRAARRAHDGRDHLPA